MPVYKFSHQLLAVLVHLAHTAVKWKTNFLILDVGDKLVNLFPASLSQHTSIHVCLVYGCTLTHCVWTVCRICSSCHQQSHLHVEFHQKVIEYWVGIESEHIA